MEVVTTRSPCLGLAVIAVLALGLSACAGGVGVSTQSANGVDAPVSAPALADDQSGQSGDGDVDATTVLEFTHVPEGYVNVPGMPSQGIGYEKEGEGTFSALVKEEGPVPVELKPEDLFLLTPSGGLENVIKEEAPVSADGTEFELVYGEANLAGTNVEVAAAVAERDGKFIMVIFTADPNVNPYELDPAMVKSVIEGIKWKK